MDITEQAQRLHAVGFRDELLDRAVALAGARRLVYKALLNAVAAQDMTPEEALQAVESGWD